LDRAQKRASQSPLQNEGYDELRPSQSVQQPYSQAHPQQQQQQYLYTPAQQIQVPVQQPNQLWSGYPGQQPMGYQVELQPMQSN